jgi:uncharacterized protein YbcI
VVEYLRVLHHVGFFVFDDRTTFGTTETTKHFLCNRSQLSGRTPVKTKGEIESAIGVEIGRFEQDYVGRNSKDIQVHLIDDLLLIRLRGILAPAEHQLAKVLPAEKGRDLLKQVWSQLIEANRPIIEAMVENVIGIKILTIHHDISTTTGEEVILITLARSLDCA